MILITGANGQLGVALSRRLERRRKAFWTFCRETLDIGDFARVREAIETVKPELVINCAAYNDVDKAETHWKEAIGINGIGVRNLAVVCGEKRIPLVCVSSDFVFDGKTDRPYTIADEPHPINAYGRSKRLGENFLLSLTDRYYLVRTSCVFGSGCNNFPGRVMSWSQNNDTIRIVDDQVSSPTLAEDLGEAILTIAQSGAYGVYHFHNEGECSRYDWAEYVLGKTGWKGKLEPVDSNYFATAAKRPAYSVLDLFPLVEMGIKIRSWQEATNQWLEDEK